MEAAPPGSTEQVGARPVDGERNESEYRNRQDDLEDHSGTRNNEIRNHRNREERDVHGKDFQVAFEQLEPGAGEHEPLPCDLRAAPHVLAAFGPGPRRVDAERDHGEEEVLENQQEQGGSVTVELQVVDGRLVDG